MSFFKDSSPGKAAAPAASADGLALVTVTLLDSTFEWKEETEKDKYKHKNHAQIKANWGFLACKSKERIHHKQLITKIGDYLLFFNVFAPHCSFEKAIDLSGSALPEFSP